MVAPPSPDLTGVCGPGVDQIVDRHTCIDLRLGGRVSRRTGAPVRRRRGAGTADTGARRIRLPTRPAKDTRVSTPTSRYRAFTRPGWLPPRRRCRRHKELVGTGHPQHPSRYRAAHIPALVPPLALRQSGRVGMWRSRGTGRRPCERSGGPSSPAPVADTGGTAGAHAVRGSGPNRAPSGEAIGVRSTRAHRCYESRSTCVGLYTPVSREGDQPNSHPGPHADHAVGAEYDGVPLTLGIGERALHLFGL